MFDRPAGWRGHYWDPLYGDPWQTPEEREAYRARRVKAWIAALSAEDWRRIEGLADQVRPGFCPARLDDLEARGLAVGVREAGRSGGTSGERIGTLRKGAIEVLAWPK